MSTTYRVKYVEDIQVIPTMGDGQFDSITCIISGYFCIPQLESKRTDV